MQGSAHHTFYTCPELLHVQKSCTCMKSVGNHLTVLFQEWVLIILETKDLVNNARLLIYKLKLLTCVPTRTPKIKISRPPPLHHQKTHITSCLLRKVCRRIAVSTKTHLTCWDGRRCEVCPGDTIRWYG